MKKPIAISLSPDAERKDVLFSIRSMLCFWTYFRKDSIVLLERWFQHFFNVPYSISFATGRAALVGVLKSLDMKEQDEVALQAFTCVAVPDAVLSASAKPVYIDVTKSLTMDPLDLQKKISKKTKAIIVQHTFGIPADMEKILSIAKEFQIPLIEDCAHVIGGEYNHKKLGTFGIASIFSFARDKAFSSVFGGMVITGDKTLGKKIREYQKELKTPSFFWTYQQLFHPIAFSLIIPLYNFFYLGKIILVVLQRLHLLSFPVLPVEKRGSIASRFLKKMPNNLAALALLQLERIKRFNSTRISFVTMYEQAFRKSSLELPWREKAPLLRFPVLSKKRDEIVRDLRNSGIYVGNWYANGIDPRDTEFEKISYSPKSCPKASRYAKEIFNLPTNPTLSIEQARFIVKLLKKFS